MAGVTNRQVLDAIQSLRDKELADIKADLVRFNGRIRFAEQSVVSLATSRKVANEEIKDLRKRTSVVSAILALGQIIIAAIGMVLFGDRGP